MYSKELEITLDLNKKDIATNVLVTTGGTYDHNKLENRDIENQHPISAITGLSETLEAKQDKGDYALKSDIPDTTNLATKTELQNGLNNKQDKGNYALKSEIPTNNNQLANGAGYITSDYHDSTKQDVINDLNAIRQGAELGSTALQSIPDEYVTETELNAKGYLTSYTETDPVYTADKPNLALKSEIPTKTSQLTNDSNYITSSYHDSTKQDKLAAGDNITIVNNVISATGGGGSGTVDGQIDSTSTNAIQNKAVYNFVVSRGENLITNGSGYLGTNYNFSPLVFDGAVVPEGCTGSFKVNLPYGSWVMAEKMPVNPNQSYQLTFQYMTEGATPRGLFYLDCYDVEGYVINDSNVNFVSGSMSELSQDLKAGDEYAYFTQLNFKTTGSQVNTNANHWLIWDYVNCYGKVWEPETYTRNTLMNATANYKALDEENPDGAYDFANNRAKLRTPYSGATVKAGTKISQGAGGGRVYIINGLNVSEYNTWEDKSVIITNRQFRKGTANVNFGCLFTGGALQVNVRFANFVITSNATLPIKVENGNIYMYNGTTWKQISN